MYETTCSRWQAIQSRDQSASSAFVYAVISTKIYCRPGCPSRLARRANVRFYDTGDQAAAAGYRACLRCKPDQLPAQLESNTAQRDAVSRACEYIEQMKGQVKFTAVATRVGLSTRYLYAIFKVVTGTTPARYADRFKPVASVPEVSTTPSAVSGTTASSEDTVAAEPVMDSAVWNALLDFGGADHPMPREDMFVGLQYDAVFNYCAPLPALDIKGFDVDGSLDFTSFSPSDPFLLDTSLLDLSPDMCLR